MTPLNAEQRAALDAPGADVAVAAGAGTGKTTLLTEAVWEDLERDRAGVDEILVATYNRAAAEHLAARLLARFADPRDGRGWARAGLDLSAAWVGTFHALCGRIAREHPFAAGVDPGFTELDDTAAAALVEAALDEAMEATDHPGFDDLLARSTWLEPVRAAAVAAHERLRAAGNECPRITVPAPTRVVDAARVLQAARAVAAHPDARTTHRAAAAAAAAMADERRLPRLVPKASRTCTADLRPSVDELNDAIAQLVPALADVAAHHQLEGFAAYFAVFADAYRQRKRELGALDYEDLQLAARRVLRGDHPYRFRRIYVDEYQDANALQDEIIDRLGAHATRIVRVGDGAQAIYGFRHADSARFARRAAEASATRLRANHRSQGPLLEALNGWLAAALAGEPAFMPLAAAAAGEPDAPALADPPAELITVLAEGPDALSRAHEAVATAEAVRALLDRGFAHRDIAVLFRALTMVGPYRAALEEAGVPTHLVAGEGFFDHQQVVDVLALLRLVENPRDEEALVRVLGSPYVSASDDDLVALREAAGDRRPLWPAVPDVPGLDALAGLVAGLRPRLRQDGLAGLVEAVIGAREYDLVALGLADGRRRYANLRRLVRMAESFAAVRGPDLRGFLALVGQQEEAARDPGEAVLVDPDLDAVRLATVHAVKGQEFPAVIVADASHRRPTTKPLVLVDPEGRAGIRLQRHGAEAVSALGYDRLEADRRAADEAEERRVVYVALTRARRHVTVIGRTATKDTIQGILGPPLDAGVPGVGHRTVVVPDPAALDAGARPEPPAVIAAPPPPVRRPPRVDRVAGRRLSFTALQRFGTCSLRYHMEVDLGMRGAPRDPISVPGDGGTGPWGGAVLGNLVHAALERHAWGGPPPAPGWAERDAALAGLEASPAEAARAESLVDGLVEGPLAARIAAGRAVPERRFALVVGGAVLTGAVDCFVVEEDGGALLLDWKTHRLDGAGPAALMSGYRLQQALYGVAALRAGHPRAELCWVFLEAPGDPQVRRVTAADAPALEAEVLAALGAIREGERSPAATEPQPFCAGCPGLRAFCPVSASAPG